MFISFVAGILCLFSGAEYCPHQDNIEESYLLAHLEITTDNFLYSMKNKDFEEMLSLTTGHAYEIMFEFVRNYRADAGSGEPQLPSKWQTLGAYLDRNNNFKCVAEITFKEGGNISEFRFVQSGGKWKVVDIYNVSDEDLPELNLHPTEKENREINDMAFALGQALSEYRDNKVAELGSQRLNKEFVEKEMSSKSSMNTRKRYYGSMITMKDLSLKGKRDKVELEMLIEHKDARSYHEKWILRLDNGWKLDEIER